MTGALDFWILIKVLKMSLLRYTWLSRRTEVSEVLQLRFWWLFSLLHDDLGGGLAISLCSEQLHSKTSSEIVKAEPYCGYSKACKCMMCFSLPKRPVLGWLYPVTSSSQTISFSLTGSSKTSQFHFNTPLFVQVPGFSYVDQFVLLQQTETLDAQSFGDI